METKQKNSAVQPDLFHCGTEHRRGHSDLSAGYGGSGRRHCNRALSGSRLRARSEVPDRERHQMAAAPGLLLPQPLRLHAHHCFGAVPVHHALHRESAVPLLQLLAAEIRRRPCRRHTVHYEQHRAVLPYAAARLHTRRPAHHQL